MEVIRFDTRAINSFNISQTQSLMRPAQVCRVRSNSMHDGIMRQIELINSWKYFLYAMFDDSRSNEELTWGSETSSESSWLQHWGTVQNLLLHRGIWKYLYRDYNFVQKPLWSWSGLYHLLLSPNQWLPEVFVWTQWACFQEGANNRVVTSVTIVTSWVSPDYVNHGADEVFSQFLAASNIQIAPVWHSWVSLVCVMSYDLISLNVWAPNVISVSIRIFLGPSISRVSGPCWCLCPASLWGRQSCCTNTGGSVECWQSQWSLLPRPCSADNLEWHNEKTLALWSESSDWWTDLNYP